MGRLFLILRNLSEQTLLSFDLKKDIKHPDFDERILGLDFVKYLGSPSLAEGDHVTKSMLCRRDRNIVTADDFNDLEQFLESHAVVETFKDYKKAIVNFQQLFFGRISSPKTTSKLQTCIDKVINVGRTR